MAQPEKNQLAFVGPTRYGLTDLFHEGKAEKAKKIAAKVLKDLVNTSGLLKEGYKIEELPVPGSLTWQPAQGVLNAIKKIHEGTPLDLFDNQI